MNMPVSDPMVSPSGSALRGRKSVIARDFGDAAASYDQAARLQRAMGQALIDRLPPDAVGCGRVLDLGCGTGYFLPVLQAHLHPQRLTGIDLSPGMLEYARRHRSVEADWLLADAESVPLPDASQDVVFSNLMIQWCADPEPVLRECRRLLRPGGWLLCSTLLDGTLAELAHAWETVDPGQPHVNDFESATDLRSKLAAVFPHGELHQRTLRLDYAHPADLLRELKALGAHHKAPGRRTSMTGATRIRQLYQHYPRASDGTAPASYEAGFLVARRGRD
ncbi:malonyl-ACP O-methyltransferase BioC [Marinobacter bohaiensis]|uniref:malonyl-ACP O-methyltransferase BioC n=1 Tax=Marinobacter bohaiensis TaxID=2201898 RepID=UPI001D17447E|nr:malonyl-ACP O-methyltransferase BioC [Marinobacter bohaiensis]